MYHQYDSLRTDFVDTLSVRSLSREARCVHPGRRCARLGAITCCHLPGIRRQSGFATARRAVYDSNNRSLDAPNVHCRNLIRVKFQI